MKKIMLSLLVIILFCFCACSPSVSTEFQKPSTDGYEAFFSRSVSLGTFVEISSGSYYSDGEYIYYTDNDNTQYIKLCGKPDCSHNDVGCNAYIESYVIGCYEDHIYWVNLFEDGRPGYALYRMNLDGTDHEIVYTLTSEQNSGCSYKIHNGYLFYKLRIRSTDSTIISDILYKRSLEPDSTPKEICRPDEIGEFITFIPTKNNLFIPVFKNNEEHYYKYNIESEELNMFIENHTNEYTICFGDNNAYIFVSEEGVYKISYEDCSISMECELDISGNYTLYFYKDNIFFMQYLDTERSDDNLIMYVYTDDYEQVAKAELDFPIIDKSFVPLFAIWDDKIIFSDMGIHNRPTYYAYIEDIINGEAEFHKID